MQQLEDKSEVILIDKPLRWTSFDVVKKIKYAGVMFGIYLMMNGFERFWIEKIRVNTVYNIIFNPTQAEIISSLLIIAGIVLFTQSKKWFAVKKAA